MAMKTEGNLVNGSI